MYGCIGKNLQSTAVSSSPSSSSSSPFVSSEHTSKAPDTPDLIADSTETTSPSSTSSLPYCISTYEESLSTIASKHFHRIASNPRSSSTDQIQRNQSTFQDPTDGAEPTAKLHTATTSIQFDSLHDLLERAGYKETRVVTPDRRGLAGMVARNFATPPKSQAGEDGFKPATDSPSEAADELRKAMQKGFAAGGSKSLPTRAIKSAKKPSTSQTPLPSSGWLSSLWIFGPGLVNSSVDAQDSNPLLQDESSETDDASSTPQQPPSTVVPGRSQMYPAMNKPAVKKTATQNQVWTASVAYRSAKSRTAPVRGKVGKVITTAMDDSAAEAEWNALQTGGGKKRRGLVEAFTSPTKKDPTVLQKGIQTADSGSPTKQRKWRQERAAWRESLGDLQAMMDQSRMRREASVSSSTTADPVQTTELDEAAAVPSSETSPLAPSTSISTSTDADAIAKLLSGPALPFLTTDPAVAPRNGACTKPAHLSLRRLKSVEVLSKVVKERTQTARDGSGTSSFSFMSSSTAAVDGDGGRISPSSKRSTPPRLTISSPRGITSPKDLELIGKEFEPRSWSPHDTVLISNRKVTKKPRSKLRNASSNSELRQTSKTQDDALKTPRGRSKSKSRRKGTESPEQQRARSPVGMVVKNSIGTLSRAAQIQALRQNSFALDEQIYQDTPTRSSSRGSHRRTDNAIAVEERQPLTASTRANHSSMTQQGRVTDDVFGTATTAPTLKKKDFSARITRTSKIMRLIEEAENVPSISSLLSQDAPALSQTRNARTPILQSLQHSHVTGRMKSDVSEPLSTSLSQKSKERMHTITRVLGQRIPSQP